MGKIVTEFEKITVDLCKGFFKVSELTKKEIDSLLRAGYKFSEHIELK